MTDADLLARDDAIDLGPLEDVVGFAVRLAQLRIFQAFFDHFAGTDVRPGVFTALVAIGINPDIRQGALARALMIKRSNMAKMMSELEDRGYITRRVPSEDRRAVQLRLTKAGRTFVDANLPDLLAQDRRATAALSPRERAELLRLLSVVAGNGPATDIRDD